MPQLRIYTNVPESKIPQDLAKTLCQVVATSIGKPVKVCGVTIIPVGHLQSFGGTNEPSAVGYLMSMGFLDIEDNIRHTKAIMEALSKSLGIEQSRMCITFNDAAPKDIGFDGTTMFDHLNKQGIPKKYLN